MSAAVSRLTDTVNYRERGRVIQPARWGDLAKAVLQRRQELGLTRPQVLARGGPSISKQQQIERGDPGPMRTDTIGRIERSMEWAPGSVERILGGGQPVIREDRTTLGRTVESATDSPVQTPRVVFLWPDQQSDVPDAIREEMAKVEADTKARVIQMWLDYKASQQGE